MTSRFFVGRKTSKFDALDAPLIITSRQEGISAGNSYEAARPRSPIPPSKVIHSNGQDHIAIEAADGGIYKVEGVELVPVLVTKYVRYTVGMGFTEVDEDTFTLASVPAAAEPADLVGSAAQINYANVIRAKVMATLANEEDATRRANASKGVATIKSAKWWLSRKDARTDSIIAELERVADR